MRILIVHNHYGDYAVGGEAMVMRVEAILLQTHGHFVYTGGLTRRSLGREFGTKPKH